MAGTLSTIIRLNSPVLQVHLDKAAINLDAQKLLLALVGCESSFGHFIKPRHEPGYDVGGKYFNKSLHDQFGPNVAYSFSAFQMMYSTAHELGFDGNPIMLETSDDYNGGDWIVCPLVCEYWRLRVIERGHKSLEDFFDAYNSGSVGGFIPTDYIKKGVDYYGQSVKWLEGQLA